MTVGFPSAGSSGLPLKAIAEAITNDPDWRSADQARAA
jgi:hypothetical protein